MVTKEKKLNPAAGYSNPKQTKSFTTCLKSFKGLTTREAESILFDLLKEIKIKSVVS
jgi:hypothetical protein